MPEVWLDFINPVDISTGKETKGSFVGGPDALRTDDGDASYIEVSNATRFGAEDARSKVFQLELEPDPSLPELVLSYDIRWYSTIRTTVSGGAGVILARLTSSGSQTIAAGGPLAYTEDGPRGNTLNGPTWEQIRNGGWLMPVQGDARLSGTLNYLRVTRLQLWVTYEPRSLARVVAQPPRRLWPREDGLTGGAPRLSGSRSRQASNRINGSYL